MLETKMDANAGRVALQEDEAPVSVKSLRRVKMPPREEEKRIRAVFDLPEGARLPRVTLATLAQYHAYLTRRLSVPFQGLYADTEYPVRHTVRYVTVLGLLPLAGRASQGIHCEVAGAASESRLSLVDIGLADDHPNCQLVDDFTYWFANCR